MNTSSKDKLKLVKTKRLKYRIWLKKYFGIAEDNLLNQILGQCYLFTDEVAAKKRNNLPKFPRIKGVFQTKKKMSKEVCWLNKVNINEDSFYTDSTAFLKGTQSSNPHNDYAQYFVDTGQRPQNFIRDTGLKNRFEEYPKLRELIRLKDKFIADSGCPPMYLKSDLSNFKLSDLNMKFDVILVEPPLEEYNRMNGAVFDKYWSWSEIEALEIEQIASPRCFIWLWCGSGQGLNEGRKCLSKWGFRRCEDICWIKTNKKNPGHKNLEPGALFQRTKEHCLMGIKGTVRRSTDGDFIHANVDIDLIIDEEPLYSVKDKPVEIFHIIEHFCLGRRRLHLFGRDSTIRQGWLTLGSELTSSNFDSRVYSSYFKDNNASSLLVPFNEDVERLRPKSPPPRQNKSQQSNAGQSSNQMNTSGNSGGGNNSGGGSLVGSTANSMLIAAGINNYADMLDVAGGRCSNQHQSSSGSSHRHHNNSTSSGTSHNHHHHHSHHSSTNNNNSNNSVGSGNSNINNQLLSNLLAGGVNQRVFTQLINQLSSPQDNLLSTLSLLSQYNMGSSGSGGSNSLLGPGPSFTSSDSIPMYGGSRLSNNNTSGGGSSGSNSSSNPMNLCMELFKSALGSSSSNQISSGSDPSQFITQALLNNFLNLSGSSSGGDGGTNNSSSGGGSGTFSSNNTSHTGQSSVGGGGTGNNSSSSNKHQSRDYKSSNNNRR